MCPTFVAKTLSSADGYKLSLERNGAIAVKDGKRVWVPASNLLGVEWA